MVSFHDDPEQYDNPAIMHELTKQMFASIAMDANIREMDKEITLHPHYIHKCQNSMQSALADDGVDHRSSFAS